MRILHWAFPFHPGRGGQSIWIERMVRAYAHKRHAVALMVDASVDLRQLKKLFCEKVTIIQTSIKPIPNSRSNVAHVTEVALAIDKFRPDVIHVHNLESQALVYLRLFQLMKNRSIPLICTLHDLTSVKRLQSVHSLLPNLSNFSAIVSPSKFIDAQVNHLANNQGTQFRVINHGVPSINKKSTNVSNFPTLLFASDLHNHKGGVILMSAWKSLCKNFPDVILNIAGDGQAKKFLEDYSMLSDLKGQVRFLGWLGQDQLSEILQADCILIVPSLLGEAFGLIAAEAAMAGAAIIVSRIGALPEIIENEVSGLVVTPSDSFELAGAVQRLLADKELRLSLGKAAKARAENLFSFDKSVSAYEILYKECASKIHAR